MSILQVQKESRSSLKDPDLLLSSAADGTMMPLTCGMYAIHRRPWCRVTRVDTFSLCNPNQIIQVGRDARRSLLTCCSLEAGPACSEILSGLSWKTSRTEIRQPVPAAYLPSWGKRILISSQNMFSSSAIVFY